MSSKIKNIIPREIIDSRGNPTIETKIILENGILGVASVPSGASTGQREAVELRDNDLNRYCGKGVLQACQNVEKIIAPLLIGMEASDQSLIDQKMIEADGTANKSKLGANAILSVSLAVARAAAATLNKPLYQYIRETYQLALNDYRLPSPMLNVINGGKHADNKTDIQEYMLVFPGQNTLFSEKIRMATEIFNMLKNILKSVYGYSVMVGDEGGFAPALNSNEEALKILTEVIKDSNYRLGRDLFLGLDCAASEFFDKKTGQYKFEQKPKTKKEMIVLYQSWLVKYPIVSIEDPFADDDWETWQEFTTLIKSATTPINLVGDDLFTTNVNYLQKGIDQAVANAILIKLNQIGTLTETINCINLAKANNYKTIISHRSGETTDDFIADLAVAVNADFIKAGAPSRGERVVKYNRLMEIERELEA
ncbi:MAG: phosphopyruvate hydratase [Patescibacteria group bacterium]